MAMSESGFKRRTFDEIVSSKEQKARELFGEDINTDENTPLGKFIRINAYDEAAMSEEMEMMYYSIFPNTATGVSLDRLCKFIGISRNPATASMYNVTLSGTEGTEITSDFLVGTESGITFYNTDAFLKTIDENGTITILVACTETGEIGNVKADEITLITNPIAGVDSITSVSLYRIGTETESDYSLRKRFETAVKGTGACNEDAIIAAVMSVPTVTSVCVETNDTNETNSNGLPPHSFKTYVTGGEDYKLSIAEAIYSKKPIGIKTVGDISQSVKSNLSGDNYYQINFSFSDKVNVYVKCDIKTTTEFGGSTGKQEIKDNIESLINNLGGGETVFISSLYGEIHKVNGVKSVSSLKLSTDGSTWATNDITVQKQQTCVCVSVEVNLV